MTIAAQQAVTLVNVLSVHPGKQQELLASLRQNTETVIRTLPGWISTRLIASGDGKRIVIHSQWDSAADVEAMRADPRMQAYFPTIRDLASFDSILGTDVLSHHR
ncbi:antibiotic biosynthesis monooxygenase [Pigmentiphaga sp. H8]|uniref:putative quinol monooxygenase n=1 Tax=unclassified Pigmentiphaga TaxID=2626614 RepID=UPI000F5A148A|nr:antibiotic biosynthesis monooxygenase [Pigmentiphaga sp. H8]AZG08988.1 antibiotic biosynthesis monooxygenase [Pigmentiphaga sp. H8]